MGGGGNTVINIVSVSIPGRPPTLSTARVDTELDAVAGNFVEIPASGLTLRADMATSPEKQEYLIDAF